MHKPLCTSFLYFFFLINSFAQKTNNAFSFSQKVNTLIEVLNKTHCDPQKVDDVFSQKLFKVFIDNVDPEKRVFTKEDLAQIKNNEFLLDDQIKAKKILFVAKVAQLYQFKIQKIDSLLVSITNIPLNFNSKFIPNTAYDSLAANESELKTRFQRDLKYAIFENIYYSLLDTLTLSLPVDYLNTEKLRNQEKISRIKIRDRFKNRISEQVLSSKKDLNEVFELIFLHSIAKIYDNHSDYFSTEQAAEFLTSGNPETEVFGFGLDENKRGEIIIANLLPGGPAWDSGLINEGDLLINFTYEGQKTVNVLGEDLYEINEKFDKANTKNLTLTLRKPTKDIHTVKLSKELILLENEIVRGLILEKKEKYGYINLPAFYSETESDGQLGCANDVAKELLKMKEDNIKGLILDLRFNGGGSVQEALDLAGIFIDYGIFGATQAQQGKSQLLKDPNRGSIFDGPMIVLVNQASASASEILAGILQDYNRALIVGSNTYGKGVAQVVLPLDTLSKIPEYFAKITALRVFSPSGKAIQHKGILPDIILPSILDGMEIEEKNEPFSLKPMPLDRTLYFSPDPKFPVTVLAQKSLKRVESNSNFQNISKMSEIIKDLINNEKSPLEMDWEIFCNSKIKSDKIFEIYNKDSEKIPKLFSVNVPFKDREREKVDEIWNKINTKLFDQISKDFYINEALEILTNLKE